MKRGKRRGEEAGKKREVIRKTLQKSDAEEEKEMTGVLVVEVAQGEAMMGKK